MLIIGLIMNLDFYTKIKFFPNEVWVVDKYAKKLAKKKFKNVKIKLIKNPLLAYLKKKKIWINQNKFLIATILTKV